MLKALSGPYLHTGARFIALGGITTANMSEYLDVPIVADVGGSWIVEPSLLAARNWTEVTQRARDALAAVAAARKQ